VHATTKKALLLFDSSGQGISAELIVQLMYPWRQFTSVYSSVCCHVDQH